MRHNYATNPSLETGTTGYATTGGVLTSGGTLTNPAGGAVGTKQGHVAVTASGQGVSFTAAPAAPGRFKLLAQRPVDPDYKAFVLSKSPAFYLALDSTDGFTDLSGNGHNGTATGGVTAGSATGPHHRFNGVGTRTNMCVDPLFGAGSLARWTTFTATAAIASTTLPTGLGGGTGNVCEVTPSGANGGIKTYNSAVTPSGGVPATAAAHRAGFWMKTDGTTQTMLVQFVCWNAGGTGFDTHTYTPSITSAWTWVSTADVAQSGTTHIVVNIRANGTYVGTKFSFVGLMLEEGSAAAPTEAEYFPRPAQITASEARWTGTAHVSKSELAVQASGAAFFDGIDDRVDTGYNTRRNYCPNPALHADTTLWSTGASYWINGGATLIRQTGFSGLPAGLDLYGGQITCPGAASGEGATSNMSGPTFVAGRAYSLSVYLHPGTTGKTLQLSFGHASADHADLTISNAANSWTRYELAWTPASDRTTAAFCIRTSLGLGPQAAVISFAAALVEQASSAGTYFPTTAQLASGEAGWTGTANASASEIGPLANGTPRTFMFWLNRDPAGYGTGRITLGNQLGGAGQYDVILQFSSTNATLYMGGTAVVMWSGLPAAGAYNHYMIVVDKTAVNRARLYVNGLLHTAETDISARSWYGGTTTQNLQVGRYSGSQYTYGKMGGVSVHYSALTATDAANAFASGRAEFILASGTTELGRAVAGTAWTQLDFPVSSGSQTLSIRTIAPRDFEFDAVQVGDDIDYRDGNHPGWEWTGTPDASTSQSLVGPDARHPILTIADYEAAIELAEQETTMTIENPTTTTEIET